MDTLSEILIQSYPQSISLDDGSTITLRPLLKTDEAALVEYFGSLPPEDRLCLKEDVTDPSVIENWIYDLNYDTILPLVALHNGHIVGDATLHFNPIGWTRHQAEVRLTTSTQYRVRAWGRPCCKTSSILPPAWAWSRSASRSRRSWTRPFTCLRRWGLRKWPT